MFKKIILINFILILNPIFYELEAKINIEMIIGDKIITNYDIQQETEYLKILNPNIQSLNTEKIFELSKDSLIKEKISYFFEIRKIYFIYFIFIMPFKFEH